MGAPSSRGKHFQSGRHETQVWVYRRCCRLRPRPRGCAASRLRNSIGTRTWMILIRHGQTEFNRIFSVTRRDPGIRDPCLTDLGRRQAVEAADMMKPLVVRQLIASPYARALETAEIIGACLGLPIAVDALIAERCVFACDIGSPVAELRNRWPDLAFDHLPDPWWPAEEESEEMLVRR